jgi:hypothetical protein
MPEANILNEFENEFEVVFSIISEFKKKLYRELAGFCSFHEMEVRINERSIVLLKNSMATESIGKKAANFYIFELGLQNAVLIENMKKFQEIKIKETQQFTPKFSATLKK